MKFHRNKSDRANKNSRTNQGRQTDVSHHVELCDKASSYLNTLAEQLEAGAIAPCFHDCDERTTTNVPVQWASNLRNARMRFVSGDTIFIAASRTGSLLFDGKCRKQQSLSTSQLWLFETDTQCRLPSAKRELRSILFVPHGTSLYYALHLPAYGSIDGSVTELPELLAGQICIGRAGEAIWDRLVVSLVDAVL